jgi:NMD protein affecting ribosome stability and mRNA decay
MPLRKGKGRKMKKIICVKCGKETNWDTSYGLENHLVCSECFDKMCENKEALEVLRDIMMEGVNAK